MDKKTLDQFESLCIQEEPPACQTMCPLHLEARTLSRLLADGKIGDARKLLDRFMPLSGLTGYLCEGPCQTHCRRSELDEGIDMPLLERFVASQARPPKPMPLPATGKSVAVIGGGLSSLVTAWELGKKGYRITIFHQGQAGGRLRELPTARLPENALPSALDQLGTVRVSFEEVPEFSARLLERAKSDFQSVYLGFDDTALTPAALGLGMVEVTADPVTLSINVPDVYAFPTNAESLFIDEMAAGRRAAGSISRVLEGGLAVTARGGEATYPTRLYTDLTDEPQQCKNLPADPLAPTPEEAKAEAGRCIQCQCLECVKKCAYLRHYKGYPKKYAREIYNNISTAFGIRHGNTMILSCAECGQCGVVCPNGADMGRFCAVARREMVEVKHMPASAHEFALEDLLYSNSPDISFFRHQPGLAQSQWLFFPGCQLPASLPGQTAGVYRHLTEKLSGGVGFMLGCCGAPARWSGRPRLTGQVADGLRKAWEEAGRPRVILACASCKIFFQAELADIPVESLWDTLSGLTLPDTARAAAQTLALHDPCAARHEKATLANVRSLLAGIGQNFDNPPPTEELTRCCGYGGLAASANPAVGEKYALDRAGDTDKEMLAYCIMCRDRLRQVGKPALHLLDLLFPERQPAEALARPAPGISDRQETRLAFRRKLLAELWGENEEEPMDDIDLTISEELAQKLEARRIRRTDITAVLREAQKSGAPFVNSETGRQLACLRPRQVTFWVEFTLEDDSYVIHDAYCHRMVVPGVPGEGADSPATLEGYAASGGRV